jgi:hypothetical protein
VQNNEDDANAYEYDENGMPMTKPEPKVEKTEKKEETKGSAKIKEIEKEINRLNQVDKDPFQQTPE